MKQYRKRAFILAALLVAFLLGYVLKDGGTSAVPYAMESVHDAYEEAGNRKMVHVCPMMCVPPMETPGKCPICGMDLIPVYGGTTDDPGSPRVKLTKEAAKLAEIETAAVERKAVSAQVRLFGQIDYDPAHIATVATFMPGVIDRIYVKRPGLFVRWGQPLFDISSTDLMETQKELIEAMKFVPSFFAFQSGIPHAAREMPVQDLVEAEKRVEGSPEKQSALRKIASIRHKFSLLGLPKRDIDELMTRGEATGIATLYSYIYGQVIEVNANEGTYVNRGATVFTIGDPRHVWARLDAYEVDYPWLRLNQETVFETDAYPGETFTGRVVYIDPVFNAKTRTFKLGVVCPDMGGRLKAGMLVRANIRARLSEDGTVRSEEDSGGTLPLVIPASAPLVTGKRALVYVKVPDQEDVFESREIRLGPRSESHYVVLSGLEEGEQVVKNGSFKIDSSVQILAKHSMMSIEGGHSAVGHHHHGGSALMEKDYQERRLKNLMTNDADHKPAEQYTSHHKDQKELESFRSMMSTGQRKTITRRKPGMYGDSAQ
ncbi:MAG: efflux RND transporter periplasmic adaptor subunit [Desulfobacteraceae bacterium]|nr:MAG: efflux RND transporter periplasmic adaptor subunit [Desulfobacteraceae bacterium]